ncbi:outer membrane beta-barrel protein [Rickettsiella endosymbiont of Aleochara curtula]|uniref:outer membrane beta-barrel protein n=1 Tax=Rickettsiella endosymbiont of Aleochara curtula TaxID=3077936 RepID=UPI00313D88AB
MFKRIIAASVLGVSALGMMTANATTNGVYVTGQLGYAQTGNQFKAAKDLSDVTIGKAKSSAKGLAGRIAIGYQFTPHWAAELGYLQLGQQKSNFSTIDTMTTTGMSPIIIHGEPQPMSITTSTTVTQKVTINQHAFDIVGKGIYPINDKFNVYAKAGMAYLVTTVKGDKVDGQSIMAPIAKHNWAPEAGLGFTYNVTSNVFIDTSITHIQPMGKNKPNSINFAAVGIGYSFG